MSDAEPMRHVLRSADSMQHVTRANRQMVEQERVTFGQLCRVEWP